MIKGIIYGLDLGISAGIAWGLAGERPSVIPVTLKRPDEHRAVAFARLDEELRALFGHYPPTLVVKEKMLHVGALMKVSGGSDDNFRMHAGLHAIVEGLAHRCKCPWAEASAVTVRKHFIGQAHCGDRAATKRAVIARCHLLKLLPRDCRDDNLADACATWSWATATWCGRAAGPGELHLFGEMAGAP